MQLVRLNIMQIAASCQFSIVPTKAKVKINCFGIEHGVTLFVSSITYWRRKVWWRSVGGGKHKTNSVSSTPPNPSLLPTRTHLLTPSPPIRPDVLTCWSVFCPIFVTSFPSMEAIFLFKNLLIAGPNHRPCRRWTLVQNRS